MRTLISDLLLQADPGIDINIGAGSVGGGAVGAFLTTLIVGGLLVYFVPELTTRLMTRVRQDPFDVVLVGLLALVAFVVLVVLLAITIVGLPLVALLGLLAYLVGAAGGAIGFLAVADHFIGHADGWTKPLLLAAGISGLLALTGIGGLVSLVIGLAGIGAIIRWWMER